MGTSDRPGDVGKRRAYLVAVTVGLISMVVLLADWADHDAIERAMYLAVIAVDVVLLVGLATRRLPIRWADWLVFGVLAGSLAVPLLRWNLAVDAAADTDIVALIIWAGLLFPLAFVVFGTRRGLIVSVATYVAVVAGLARPTGWVGDVATTTGPGDAAVHAALMFATGIMLLWLLSARLEQLTRQQARADFLHAQATTDALTGIPNRRRLTDEADRQIALARRHGEALSVVIVDLDHFKRINDQFGHEDGDVVLVEIAQRLVGAVRASDMVGRWGGEEFVVIAVRSDLADATRLAERCRQAISARPVIGDETITASLGVATLTDDDDRRTLMRRADLALYTAKTEGRDRVVTIDGAADPADLTDDEAVTSA